MNIGKKDIFSKNKIQEAICQFTFKHPLDVRDIDKIEKKLIEMGKYSVSEKIPFINFNINFDEEKPTKELLYGVKVSNESKDKIIQIFSDRKSVV